MTQQPTQTSLVAEQIEVSRAGGHFPIRQGELISVRHVARNLYDVLNQLGSEVEKYVLLDQKNEMRAVLLSVERYAALAVQGQRER